MFQGAAAPLSVIVRFPVDRGSADRISGSRCRERSPPDPAAIAALPLLVVPVIVDIAGNAAGEQVERARPGDVDVAVDGRKADHAPVTGSHRHSRRRSGRSECLVRATGCGPRSGGGVPGQGWSGRDIPPPPPPGMAPAVAASRTRGCIISRSFLDVAPPLDVALRTAAPHATVRGRGAARRSSTAGRAPIVRFLQPVPR